MTRYATLQRALHDGKTRAVLLCLLLLGGIFTIIYIGPSRITNLAAAGFNITQPDTSVTGSYHFGQYPTDTSSDQPNQTQPITTTDCPGGTYISTYGDTVCTSGTSPTTTVGATVPCPGGTSITQYGDSVCKPLPRPMPPQGATGL